MSDLTFIKNKINLMGGNRTMDLTLSSCHGELNLPQLVKMFHSPMYGSRKYLLRSCLDHHPSSTVRRAFESGISVCQCAREVVYLSECGLFLMGYCIADR